MEFWGAGGYEAEDRIWVFGQIFFILRPARGRNFLITMGEICFGGIKRAIHCTYCIQVVADRDTNVFPVA